jgi:MFS superfamily sulfate permease-like transporter
LQYRDKFNQNVDLVGLSLANLAAACSSTFVVNGSPTKTAIVDSAGGRSQRAHLTTAAVVLLVLLFLTKPLSFLPNAALSAIVFLVGVKLVDHQGLADLYRKAPREFAVALATAATVVFIGVEQGIILAVILSLLQHVRRSYRPRAAVVVRDDVDRWRMEETEPVQMIESGLIMFWFGSDLYYANSGFFAEHARKIIHEAPTPVRWFVIDCGAITGIDYSAGRAVTDLLQDLTQKGIVLALARVQVRHHDDLEQLGLIELIGKNRLFPSRHECLEAYRLEVESESQPAKP